MQLWAIISDTYRSLRTRGLFWVIISISLILGLLYASLGCDAKGWSLFFGALHVDSDFLRAGTDWERSLLLTSLHGLLDWWGMIFASLLALFAAATIFPDTMKPGAIDFLLSKPISRFQLFLGKYLAALLFVALQTFILVGICFLSLWWRLQTPYWHIFWSVGLVVLIFSFVFCLTTLIGVLTRSGMAALLWSVLFWFLLWAVQKTEYETGPTIFAATSEILPNGSVNGISESIQNVHQVSATIMRFLPRTRQTGELFATIIQADAPYSFEEITSHGRAQNGTKLPTKEAPPRMMETITSGLIFEAVILLLAFWYFRTRDF